MHYSCFGLVNTQKMLSHAMTHHYAVPAFNIYNLETLQTIIKVGEFTKSPIIIAVSESALKYMQENVLMGMIAGLKYTPGQIALHLDHGHSYEICKHAIDIGFSSVMFDGSSLPLQDNIKISKKITNYAHKYSVTVETELGVLSGVEDENTLSNHTNYTDPNIVADFVSKTNTDSLAVAIGTSHGAYKRHSQNETLRFDILKQISINIPKTPLVLHGASSIPQSFVKTINQNHGNIQNAMGIPPAQLRKTIPLHISKINVDSDSKLAFTAGIREYLSENKSIFDPRKYLEQASQNMLENCIHEIKTIMQSNNKFKK